MPSTCRTAAPTFPTHTPPSVCRLRHILPAACFATALLAPVQADATEVTLVGIFGNKAVLVVDGGRPRTLAAGQRSPEGVKLVGVSGETSSARIELNGTMRIVELGQGPMRVDDDVPTRNAALTLIADGRGHHYAEGNINGAALRFIVDTGATTVSLGFNDAKRARIDLERANPVVMQTASGLVKAWKVRLDTVKVGPLVLHGVEATVMQNDLPVALLGMSFLSRTQMDREGNRLTLRKRF